MPIPAPLRLGFWNLENLFEPEDADRAWPADEDSRKRLARWLRGWTEERLGQKLDALAEVIAGLGPLDVLGVCEVETAGLLRRLLDRPALAGHRYAVVHEESDDRRGIDVALLYDPERLELRYREAFAVRLHFPTRSILHAEFLVRDQDRLVDVYVNHWPSRTTGRWQSEPYRIAAAEQLAWLLAHHRPGDALDAVVLGDFNDEPHCRSLVEHLDASPRPPGAEEHTLHNPCWPLLGQAGGGTYRKGETWHLLDQVLVTPGLEAETPRLARPASMLDAEGGPQRFRRSDGRGASDHLPILCEVSPARRIRMLPGGVDAVFNGRDRGSITRRILDELDAVVDLAAGRPLALHLVMFSFTSETLARRLLRLVTEHDEVTLRVLVDWTQLPDSGSRQAPLLARIADVQDLPNLHVRFKKDRPYRWNEDVGAVEFSHGASRGLNHHKALVALVDGRPVRLLTGSFNWSDSAEWDNYENLLVLDDSADPARWVLRAFAREFEAFWNDGRASLTWAEALQHRARLMDELERRGRGDAVEVVGLARGVGDSLSLLTPATPDRGSFDVAFSARAPHEEHGDAGFAAEHEARRIDVLGADGQVRSVPATLTAGVVDMIRRAPPGDTLLLAMYSLSVTTEVWDTLRTAAERGVELRVILDGGRNDPAIERLRALADHGVALRISNHRTMHHKFMVHPQTDAVWTGSANLSESSEAKHSEDRLYFRPHPELARAFAAEFERLWESTDEP